MRRDSRVTVLTAAMCEGNKLQKIRDEFPERFFDTGICEGHAVAFAAGMAKTGLRPIVDIYSTFLQRSYDQIFQEVALQNLPVTFCLDRAGLCGPDGPTHHGLYDNTYLRAFPNLVMMAPGDGQELGAMLDFALSLDSPASIRYPKCNVETVERAVAPLELGRSEIIEWGTDGMFVCFGALLGRCVEAARQLKAEGLDVGVINARFAKPLDAETIVRAVDQTGFVLTVEEGALCGGFGSAVLEAVERRRRRWEQCPLLGHSGPLHRARRTRRTLGGSGPGRPRSNRRRPSLGRRGDGRQRLTVSQKPRFGAGAREDLRSRCGLSRPVGPRKASGREVKGVPRSQVGAQRRPGIPGILHVPLSHFLRRPNGQRQGSKGPSPAHLPHTIYSLPAAGAPHIAKDRLPPFAGIDTIPRHEPAFTSLNRFAVVLHPGRCARSCLGRGSGTIHAQRSGTRRAGRECRCAGEGFGDSRVCD